MGMLQSNELEAQARASIISSFTVDGCLLRMDRTGPSPQLKDAARYGRIPRGQVDLNRR
jgi:hypothetical protein